MKARMVDTGSGGAQLIVDFDAADLIELEKDGAALPGRDQLLADPGAAGGNVVAAGLFGSSHYCIQVNGGDGHRETIKTWGPWAYARGYAIMRAHNGVGFQLTNGKCPGD